MRTFIDQFSNINQGIAAGERIFSIIDAQSEIQDKPGAIEPRRAERQDRIPGHPLLVRRAAAR
ncbi:MAG: hypothetical protein ACLUQ6_09665 [Alistipes onderdonkii]